MSSMTKISCNEIIRTSNFLHSGPKCNKSATNTQVTNMIFKLALIHACAINFVRFDEFTEFSFQLGKNTRDRDVYWSTVCAVNPLLWWMNCRHKLWLIGICVKQSMTINEVCSSRLSDADNKDRWMNIYKPSRISMVRRITFPMSRWKDSPRFTPLASHLIYKDFNLWSDW